MNCGGALEVEIVAGFFAFEFDGGTQGIAVSVETLDEAIHFGVVFLFGAAGEARSETHFHFGIEAAGKSGIAANFYLAAPDFEEVEDALGKSEGEFAGREGAVVGAGGWRAAGVDGNVACDDAAWVGVAQGDF